jgi:glutamate racemase
LPYEKYIYLGDTARVPYGNKSAAAVKRYSAESTEFMLSKGVKLIVVACNTVSAVALDTVRELANVPVIGMIVPASVAALRASLNGNIGVIGTRATINSNAYTESLFELAKEKRIKVYSKDCPLFVPLAEEGLLRHQATKIIAEEYLEKFKSKNIDTLVLGCTHYPLLRELISAILPGVSLIDSGEHAAVTAIRLLAERDALAEDRNEFVSKPDIDFYVTDIPSTFYEIAQRFLGFTVEKPEVIDLDKKAQE